MDWAGVTIGGVVMAGAGEGIRAAGAAVGGWVCAAAWYARLAVVRGVAPVGDAGKLVAGVPAPNVFEGITLLAAGELPGISPETDGTCGEATAPCWIALSIAANSYSANDIAR